MTQPYRSGIYSGMSNPKPVWTTLQAADAWGVSERRVRQFCAAERVPGAVLIGAKNRGTWTIPAGAPKPESERKPFAEVEC